MVKPSLILARAALTSIGPAHVWAMCWHFAHYRTLINFSPTGNRVLCVVFDEAHLLDSFAVRHVHFQCPSVTFCITCGGPAIPPLIPPPPLFSFLPPFLYIYFFFTRSFFLTETFFCQATVAHLGLHFCVLKI